MRHHKADLDGPRFPLWKSEGSCDRGSPVGETEIDSKIDENDDGMLLERITRGPVQGGPRRSSVFPKEK